uniref:Uncharacterized protein n=1 Tax=Setaria viridis TaxID=4556 RepID=A0A4U6TEE6_SETVI|nr:hypothetical protein SEVIR_9G372400v2 [Setaria viridis]
MENGAPLRRSAAGNSTALRAHRHPSTAERAVAIGVVASERASQPTGWWPPGREKRRTHPCRVRGILYRELLLVRIRPTPYAASIPLAAARHCLHRLRRSFLSPSLLSAPRLAPKLSVEAPHLRPTSSLLPQLARTLPPPKREAGWSLSRLSAVKQREQGPCLARRPHPPVLHARRTGPGSCPSSQREHAGMVGITALQG